MGYQVLARKYRPQRFADVAGQDHVTTTLLNALSQNRVAHGYIFSGHRGIGKTTIARILAMALNCRTEVGSAERPTHEPCLQCVSCREISSGGSAASGEQTTHSFDFIEIDAASNRGIDDVRSIRTQASVQPARDRYKIFLLDEAHQITDAAFNAILKTLEEPPEWTIFMMATTEPENIPQTIRSRCQHFSFHAVKFEDILAQLRMISHAEQVTVEADALALLAEAGDGSMRDALSIMDQAIASAPVENGKAVLAAAQIRELMGSVPNAVFERLLEAVAQGQSAELMEQLNVLLNAGHSPSSLARQMARYLRNTLMAKLAGEQTELLQISSDERARASRTAMLFSEEEITRNLQIVLRTFDELNYRQEQRFHLELGLLKLIHAQRLLPIEELLSGAAGGAGRGGGTGAPSRPLAAPARPSVPPGRPSGAPSGGSTGGSSGGSSASGSGSGGSSSSPFGGGSWMKQSAPAATMAVVERPALEVGPVVAATEVKAAVAPSTSAPFPAAAEPMSGFAEVAPQTEGSLAVAPEPVAVPEGSPSAEGLREAVAEALATAGHKSAADFLGGANWIVDGAALRIEVPGVGKKMLALTVNAVAEKIIRQELQKLGAPTRFLVVPGEGMAAAGSAVPAAPKAGSIQAEALAHPMVERAKEIFHAEVRSVVDLRQK